MSYRLHRAMGYGMPWNDFEMGTTLDCEAHETADKLYEVLELATDADLTVPMKFRDALFYSNARPRRSAIMDNRILALGMTFEGEGDERKRRDPRLLQATDLFQTVYSEDDLAHVIFMPNATYARQWYRYNDDLDYKFEEYRDGPPGDNGGGPRDFVHVLKFGPYPFGNFLMDPATGQALEWDLFHRLDKTYPNGWVPDIPSELRWWLPNLGILDEKGVNKLRPCIAQWWS